MCTDTLSCENQPFVMSLWIFVPVVGLALSHCLVAALFWLSSKHGNMGKLHDYIYAFYPLDIYCFGGDGVGVGGSEG